MMERKAAELAAFSGKIYVATMEYKYGWEKWGVLTEDEASAKKIFKELMASPDIKTVEKENFDDAREEYKFRLSCYRDERREMVRRLEFYDLIEPVKPLRKEFTFHLKEITEPTDIDQKMFETNQVIFEINDAEYVHSGGGYSKTEYTPRASG